LIKQDFKMSNKVKSFVVTLTLLKVHINLILTLTQGQWYLKIKVKSNNNKLYLTQNGLKSVIQIDFSQFCLPVLCVFTISALLMASQIARWTFLSQYILSLMIWIPYKTNRPTWLPLSSSKGSSLWLLWIVVYQGIPSFQRICKTPYCTNLHFEGSRLSPRLY